MKLPLFLSAALLAAASLQAAPKPELPKVPAPYINTWMVADAAPGANAAPEYFDDRLFSRNYDDYQDLRSFLGWIRGESTAARAVVATCGVWSGEERDARLWLGADRECVATLNGARIGKSDKAAPDRDQLKWKLHLKKGWNTLALRIANRDDNYLGFYARITDEIGGEIPGLVASPEGGAGALRVTTRALAGKRAPAEALPVAWREWPFVGMNPFGNDIRPRRVHASEFLLTAAGGTPPYRWELTKGVLPEGLVLNPSGTLTGKPVATARLGKHDFSVRVTDAGGAYADKALRIEVRERPNKAVEEERLLGLIHRPEHTPAAGCEPLLDVMRREGVRYALVVSCNCGPEFYNWDTKVIPAPHNFGGLPEYGDVITQYKKAAEERGLKFGFYVGGFPRPRVKATPGGMVRIFEELTERFAPEVLYFDWASARPESTDAAFSAIRTRNPNTIIQVNQAQVNRTDNGDWDQVSREGWGNWGGATWGSFPSALDWPKKTTMDTWRLLPDPDYDLTKGIKCDTKEITRLMISVICEGYTCNIDHSTVGSRRAGDPEDRLAKWEDSMSYRDHSAIAEWANPKDASGKPLPPLHESYTQVNPAPVPAAPWGYAVINTRRDAIYLHILKNPRGKKGLPADGKISLPTAGLPGKILSAVCMNTGAAVPFALEGDAIVIKAAGLTPDPVDTIVKVQFKPGE